MVKKAIVRKPRLDETQQLDGYWSLINSLSSKYAWAYGEKDDASQEMMLTLLRSLRRYGHLPEDQLKKVCLKSLYNGIKARLSEIHSQKRTGQAVDLEAVELGINPVSPLLQALYRREFIIHLRELLSGLEKRVLDEILFGSGAEEEAERSVHPGSDRKVRPLMKGVARTLGVPLPKVSGALATIGEKARGILRAQEPIQN